MNNCPACSKVIHPNDLVCPHCGISLHQGTASASPASGGGSALSVVVIGIFVVIGILLVLGCLGTAAMFVGFRAVSPPAPPPIVAPMSVPAVIEDEEPMLDSESETNPSETPAGQPTRDEPGSERDGEPP